MNDAGIAGGNGVNVLGLGGVVARIMAVGHERSTDGIVRSSTLLSLLPMSCREVAALLSGSRTVVDFGSWLVVAAIAVMVTDVYHSDVLAQVVECFDCYANDDHQLCGCAVWDCLRIPLLPFFFSEI